MNRILYTIFLILLFHDLFGCDCRKLKGLDSARLIEYVNSELVMLGEVVSVSGDHMKYKIKVLESYKGELIANQIIEGENEGYCHPQIYYKGKWIIYGYFENGKIRINVCGLTRSLESPESNGYFRTPPPPPLPLYPEDSTKYKKALMKFDIMDKEYKDRARDEVYKELELLRNKMPTYNTDE